MWPVFDLSILDWARVNPLVALAILVYGSLPLLLIAFALLVVTYPAFARVLRRRRHLP